MPERPEVRAEDLTPETASTLDGLEQLIMFDTVEGKRVLLSVIADYIAQHGKIDNTDIPTIVDSVKSMISSEYDSTKTYELGELVWYENDLYKCTTAITTAEAWTAAHWTQTDLADEVLTIKDELADVKEDLQDKADQNGVYPDLSAGNLTGDFHIDTKPYLYRALRDVASHIGSKAFDTLVGGSVAVNQQFIANPRTHSSGVVISRASDGVSAVLNGTASSSDNNASLCIISTIVGHKYYAKGGSNTIPVKMAGNDITSGAILNASWSSASISTEINAGTTYTNYTISVVVIDLTQLFASDPTIADRAYTLEQNTAGSGIAWLKSYGFLTKDYYPFNAGTLQSVLTTGKKVVGFNQFNKDATFFSGYCDGSNRYIEDNRMKSAVVPVISGATYHFNTGSKNGGMQRVAFLKSYPSQHDTIYQGDGSLGYVQYTNGTTVTNSAGFPYMIVTFFRNDVTHDDYDDVIGSLCINLSKTTGTPKNGDYLPYESVSYQISPEELRGTLKLVNNEIQYNGDIRYADGTLDRNYGIVDLGTLSWNYVTNDGDPYFSNYALQKTTGLRVACGKYPTSSTTGTGSLQNKHISCSANGNGIFIRDFDYTSAATFKTAMSGVYLVYEKVTPTIETTDPYQSPQQVFADGTEEYIDTRTVPVPVGHETKYELDLAEKLIGLPWDLSMLAPIENGATASQAYAQGKYFVRNNEFCKAKTAIASGATFTLGTNYEVTTVGAELFALA